MQKKITKENCCLCGSDISLLYTFPFNKNGSCFIYKCSGCGFKRTFPLPGKENLKTLYEKKLKHGPETGSELFRSDILGNLKERLIVRPLLKNLKNSFEKSKTPKLLDVGCSDGWITSIARVSGFEVKGLEANPYSAETARQKFGLDIIEGFLEDIVIDEMFDAVTMFHVLEHLVDPAEELKKVNKILNSGGKLLIVVPNGESLGTHIFRECYNWNVKHHVSFFTRKSLTLLLDKSGFRPFKITYLPSTPLLLNSFNRMMQTRGNEGKKSFRLKMNVFGNLAMLPLALAGKALGKGEVLAAYAEKRV